MIERILNFSIIIPASVIAFSPMKNQLKLPARRLFLLMVLLFACTVPLMAWISLQFSLGPNDVLFPALAVLFLIYHLTVRVPLCKSLSIFFSVFSLMAILGLYASIVDARKYPALGSDSFTLLYGLILASVSTAAALLLLYPMLHFGSRLIDQLNNRTVWWCTLPFSMLITGITMLLRPIKYETLYVNRVGKSVLLITTFLLILWVLLDVIFYFITTELLRSAKISEEKQMLEMQESQFNAQKSYMEATARERHDFRQSLRVLRELYNAGDMESLGRYISQYESSQPTSDVQSFCTNSALNAVLNFYAQNALKSGIDLRISASVPELHSISDVSLCRMIGNLLENALTAAGKAPEKWVELKITTVNHSMMYIITTNPFAGELKIRNGRYLSTTRHGDGIGLTSITTIAESCGGIAQFSHRDHLFYCNIGLPI